MSDLQPRDRANYLDRPIGDPDLVERFLKSDEARGQLEALAVRDLDVDRLAGVARLALARNPQLCRCTFESVLLAVADGLRLGLEPDGVHGALVPFKGKATFQPMYQGLARVAREEGAILDIYGECVRKGDVEAGRFDYWIDETGEHVKWRPSYDLDEKARGPIVGAFVVVTFPGKVRRVAFKPWPWIEKRKRVARSHNVWNSWPEEMAIKTVLKGALKAVGGRSPLLSEAIRLDDMQSAGETLELPPASEASKVLPLSQPTKLEALEAHEATLEALEDGEPTQAELLDDDAHAPPPGYEGDR